MRASRLMNLWSVLLLVVWVIAGCTPPASGPVPTPIRTTEGGSGGQATPPTPPGAEISPTTCPRLGLEQWLERAGFLSEEFIKTVNGSLTIPREQIGAVVDRLGTLRGAILVAATPDCAMQHRLALEEITGTAFNTYQEYGKGGGVDLPTFITLINSQFETIRAEQRRLEALYRQLPR